MTTHKPSTARNKNHRFSDLAHIRFGVVRMRSCRALVGRFDIAVCRCNCVPHCRESALVGCTAGSVRVVLSEQALHSLRRNSTARGASEARFGPAPIPQSPPDVHGQRA
ncbi:MAG: hypothetical protein JSV65_06245 [Armatimonadota bacterium]|nr:MAG: hypothetical protein JSV65_06245 [Armatimonadota bacterium]